MSTPDRQPPLLRVIPLDEVEASAPSAVDETTRITARSIVDSIRAGGEAVLREYATGLDGLPPSAPLVLDRAALERARDQLDPSPGRCSSGPPSGSAPSAAQKATLSDLEAPSRGPRRPRGGPHRGRRLLRARRSLPLPSSVLMTAVTGRAAGVGRVVVASPNPRPIVVAAAAIAGADSLLTVGGAQAIAALAYGVPGVTDPVNVIVGPGNRWVTAAKQYVFGDVGIDLPAGPSELVVLADASANPGLIAADLLAQAEHDPDARPALVTTEASLLPEVEAELQRQLRTLDTKAVASQALAASFAAVAPSMDAALGAVDRLAPEHLQLCVEDPDAARRRLKHHGASFLGEGSAEVFGDYGVGPNHVLPTGGAARYSGGLSVFNFLRIRTWLRLDDPSLVAADVEALAREERLTGHARAAAARARISV